MHPILFHYHYFTVYTYGFFVAVAVLTSYMYIGKRAVKYGIEPGFAHDLVFFLFVSGVLGARLFYVIQHAEDYEGHWWKILSIAEGGLVWYGGFLTASSVGVLIAAWRRWPLLRICDLFAPVVALAHAIGRIGCFFNGCCYGRPTNALFGVHFPGDVQSRIPIQLIESALLLALALVLHRLSSRMKKDGELFILYLILYSITRFIVEFFRGDQTPLGYLTPPQWTSCLLLGGALLLLYLRRNTGKI